MYKLGHKDADLVVVVSTKLSADDVVFLKTYARYCYNADIIEQPTISHVLRHLVKAHRILVKAQEKPKVPSNLVQLRPPSVSISYAQDAESRDKTFRKFLEKLYTDVQLPLPAIDKLKSTDGPFVDPQRLFEMDAEKQEYYVEADDK